MSTRGTYSFENRGSGKPRVTIYNHWDNYPSGGAFHLYQAFKHKMKCKSYSRIMTAEDFIRANDGAEITESHRAHGDTEYRYWIVGDEVKVEERRGGWGDEKPAWRTIRQCFWWEFIAEQQKAEPDTFGEDFEPIYLVRAYSHSPVLLPMTRAALEAEIQAHRDTLETWAKNGHTTGANVDTQKKDILRLQAALEEATGVAA